MTGRVTVRRVDYTNEADARALVELLNGYAMDPMGGGEALPPEVLNKLVPELIKRPHAFSIFAGQRLLTVWPSVLCISRFPKIKVTLTT